jgi:hypothetical protein
MNDSLDLNLTESGLIMTNYIHEIYFVYFAVADGKESPILAYVAIYKESNIA